MENSKVIVPPIKCCPWQEAFDGATENDYIYLDPPYIGRDTSYVGEWSEDEAIQLLSHIPSLYGSSN